MSDVNFKDRTKIEIYEGEPVPDGEYKLGQLSSEGRYGRIVDPRCRYNETLFDDMPVMMDKKTCADLFRYIKSRPDGVSIKDFTATVEDNQIVHIKE